MAERNLYMRKLLGNPARFADFYNGTVFGGHQVLHPEELSDVLGEQKRLMKIWETSVREGKEKMDMCIAIDELIEDGKI